MLNFLYLRKYCDTRIIQNRSEWAKICSEPAKSNSEAAKSSLKPVKSNQMCSEPAKSSPDPAKSSPDPAKSSWRPVKRYTMLPHASQCSKDFRKPQFFTILPVLKRLQKTSIFHHPSRAQRTLWNFRFSPCFPDVSRNRSDVRRRPNRARSQRFGNELWFQKSGAEAPQSTDQVSRPY